jgi:hypothetical protein
MRNGSLPLGVITLVIVYMLGQITWRQWRDGRGPVRTGVRWEVSRESSPLLYWTILCGRTIAVVTFGVAGVMMVFGLL